MGLLENTIGAMIGRHSGEAQNAPSSGSSPYAPLAAALIAMLAAKAMTGGFGDLLGGHQQAPQGGTPPATPQPPAGAGGLLAGLGGLLNQFQQSGHGSLVQSWIGGGQNALATPVQISQALGPDALRELARRAGIPEDQVAAQLSHELPQLVDKLTPQGRLPTHEEASAWH